MRLYDIYIQYVIEVVKFLEMLRKYVSYLYETVILGAYCK